MLGSCSDGVGGRPLLTPQPSCCCHAAMRATNWGEGGGKGGVTPIGFRPANALLAGRWVRVAEAGSSCPCGADGANVTAATWHHTPPPAPPQPANNTPRGGGLRAFRASKGVPRGCHPPTISGTSRKGEGGGWVTPPPPFTSRCFPAVCPHRLSCPSPPLSSSPPPRDRAPVTGSAYSFCL